MLNFSMMPVAVMYRLITFRYQVEHGRLRVKAIIPVYGRIANAAGQTVNGCIVTELLDLVPIGKCIRSWQKIKSGE